MQHHIFLPSQIPTTVASMSISAPPQLSTLSEWPIQRIRDIFESPTDEDSLQSIQATFTDTDTATLNGVPLPCAGITQLVLAMRSSSKTGLGVNWNHTVEVAPDPSTNRVCSRLDSCRALSHSSDLLTGLIIWRVLCHQGLRKRLPGMAQYADFERQKTATVTYVLWACIFSDMMILIKYFTCFRIESRSDDTRVDSRRITNLTFVVSDVMADRAASL
jgi:hypothetical protein